MTIEYTHPDYNSSTWEKISDICDEKNVENYLIPIKPSDISAENKARNDQYKERAVFHAISGSTVQGMLGSIFRKWPTINIPTQLEYVKDNADGSGVNIYQNSQMAVDHVLKHGRAGLAVTFPQTDKQVSVADMQSGKKVATMHLFSAEEIINWRTTTIGSKTLLSLVVTKEQEESYDGYNVEYKDVFREKYLSWPLDEDGVEDLDATPTYMERKWTRGANEWGTTEPYAPTDASGKTWEIIPFTFIGSRNNDVSPDQPPMLGIVNLNIGLYRNSADYEDSVAWAGRPQWWMSGLTQAHIDLLTNNQMEIGGPRLIAVPEGGALGVTQAPPNPSSRQAMLDKVESMIQQGARMMQVGSATKTAEQASGEREAQTSLLSMVAGNVSDAYTLALVWAARYMMRNFNEDEISYVLNQDFINNLVNPQELKEIVAAFSMGKMPSGDYIRYMKKKELFDSETSDEDYMDLLEGQEFGA